MIDSEADLLNYAKGLDAQWQEYGLDRTVIFGFTWNTDAARTKFVTMSSTWLDRVSAFAQGRALSDELKLQVNLVVRRHLRLVEAGYGTANPNIDTLLKFLGIKPADTRDFLDQVLGVVKWTAIGVAVFLGFRVYKDFRG